MLAERDASVARAATDPHECWVGRVATGVRLGGHRGRLSQPRGRVAWVAVVMWPQGGPGRPGQATGAHMTTATLPLTLTRREGATSFSRVLSPKDGWYVGGTLVVR